MRPKLYWSGEDLGPSKGKWRSAQMAESLRARVVFWIPKGKQKPRAFPFARIIHPWVEVYLRATLVGNTQ